MQLTLNVHITYIKNLNFKRHESAVNSYFVVARHVIYIPIYNRMTIYIVIMRISNIK